MFKPGDLIKLANRYYARIPCRGWSTGFPNEANYYGYDWFEKEQGTTGIILKEEDGPRGMYFVLIEEKIYSVANFFMEKIENGL